MGQEIKCRAVVDGREVEGRLQLETGRLYFRSPTAKLNIAAAEVKVKASNGILTLVAGKTNYAFELGDAAQRWEHRIQNPRSLLDKLGVKYGADVVVIGCRDDELVDQFKKVGAKISTRKLGDHSWIFVGVERPNHLKLLEGLSRLIKPNGAIWIIFPKGKPDLKAEDLIAAGKANGLIDTKIARVSDRLTGMKFVIPVKQRKPK